MSRIDWESPAAPLLLYNPRMPAAQIEAARRVLLSEYPLPGHFWVATSGSTAQVSGQLKWIALSREAVLASARAVNAHLGSDSRDRWLHVLPEFHVGGLGIDARAHLSGAQLIRAGSER